MMKNLRQIIRRPLITERSTIMKEEENKYVFEVDRRANKIEIKQAVETLFNVNVNKVSTLNVMGKMRRVRTREKGKRPDWKKAIVTIDFDQKIDLFDTAS